MRSKAEKWFTVISFFVLVMGLSIAAVLLPDTEYSKAERRRYASAPELTVKNILSGSYMSKLEDYFLDQFVGRDAFRTLKTELEVNLLGKNDANGYIREGEYLFELQPDLKKSMLEKAAENFALMGQELYPEANVYYGIIPDKTAFLAEASHSKEEDAWVIAQMQEALSDATYIDLQPYLSLEDYYKTDLHWKQESIADVAEVLLTEMKALPQERVEYTKEFITDEFYGGYAGASAFMTKSEELYALNNDMLKQVTVYDYESQKEVTVYAPEKLEGMDPYDYYLWGARALLTMKNPECENGKKLLLFRDSFGSSIAPLLIEGYEEITLVDFRYLAKDYLTEFIDVTEYDDVLILYSQRVLRNSGLLKF